MDEIQTILQRFRESVQSGASKTRFKVDKLVDNVPEILEGYYKAEVEKRGKTFHADEETKRHIAKAATWLVSDCRPGLMLSGTVGNGKTTLMRAIGRSIELLYDAPGWKAGKEVLIVSALELATIAKNDPERFEKIKKAELLAIDDVGVEPSVVKVWGNEVNPITELLYYRYDKILFTLMSSNLNTEDIANKYGVRIADRFAEMFDKVAFTNDSYR